MYISKYCCLARHVIFSVIEARIKNFVFVKELNKILEMVFLFIQI